MVLKVMRKLFELLYFGAYYSKLFVSHSPLYLYADCVKNIRISLYMSEIMYTFAE